jgi:hypothetical protein
VDEHNHEALYGVIVNTVTRRLDKAEEAIKAAKRSLMLISGGPKGWQ